ncbi:MAG: GtrA family protein [Thaumarchaeota archaeon]|jgi:dolichol-phosphate mannosyltransferase|nr:GtrA family protein [Candidatus Wolframiiraptor allenii]
MSAIRRILEWVRRKIFSITFLKFGVVGASGVVVNYGVSYACYIAGLSDIISLAIGVETAIISNFIWNDLWTFRNRRTLKLHLRILYFHVSRLLGFLATMASHYLFAYILGIPIAISYILAIGVGTLTNFFTSDLFVWPELPLEARVSDS